MNEIPPTIAIGIDISKAKFDAARLWDGKYRHKVFPNTPTGFAAFVAWMAAFGAEPVRIALEATGAYNQPLAEFLAAQGFWVSVVNPAKIKAFAQSELSRTKTDKADAKLIARYAREKQPPRWTPPPPAIGELQAWLRRLEQLQEMRQMEQNRLDTTSPATAPSIRALLNTLDREIEAVREKIRRHLDDDPDLLLVLFSDHHGFQNARQAVAFVGLAPNPHQSGVAGKARLSKVGDRSLRKVLYLPALVAWRHNPLVREFCERLKGNGKSGKAVACAAMRKLLHLAFGVLKSGQPFDPNFALA